MALKISSIKCPECAANLPIEEGREQLFCSYCGTKIVITNENERIYRHIDEAGIKQAETDRLIRLKELENEEKAESISRKGYAFAFGVALAFVVVSALLGVCGYENAYFGVFIGIYIALFTFMNMGKSKEKWQDRKNARNGLIKVTDSIADYEKKDYRTIETGLRSLGFTNIRVVNLRDLTTGLLKKPGIVAEVTINGEEIRSNKWYYPDATVVVTYHDFTR